MYHHQLCVLFLFFLKISALQYESRQQCTPRKNTAKKRQCLATRTIPPINPSINRTTTAELCSLDLVPSLFISLSIYFHLFSPSPIILYLARSTLRWGCPPALHHSRHADLPATTVHNWMAGCPIFSLNGHKPTHRVGRCGLYYY